MDNIISYPKKAMSYITGLVAALAGKKNVDTGYTLTNSLALDANSGSQCKATLNDGNAKTISMANLPALGFHLATITNAHGSNSVTVTIPTAANNARGSTTFTVPFGWIREVLVWNDGTVTHWFPLRLKQVTT